MLSHTETAGPELIQIQIAAHPHEERCWTLKKRAWLERVKLVKERTPKGGAEKFRAWGIEQTATFHHQNSNKQLFRKGGKKTEPCRFVSEGEKPVVRSNRPLIFLSCIKRSSLLGGYASERALLIFTVYLVLFANIYIHLSKIHPTMHDTEKPLSFDTIVFLCLSEELQHTISLTRLPQLL